MRSTGALLCAAGMTILGSSFAVSRLLLGYPTLTGQALRYAGAAVVLALLARRGAAASRRPMRRADLVRLSAVAFTGLAGFNVCVLAALRHADPAVLGTVLGGSPLLLAVLPAVLAGRRPSARLAASGAVVAAGVALVQGGGHATTARLLWALGALVGEVCFSLLAAPLLPELGPVRVSAWACALAVPQLVAAAVVTGEYRHLRAPTPTEATALLYLTLVLTVGAFTCWYGGIRRLGVERAGVFAGLIPVASLAGAALLDRTVPNPVQLAGTATVALALVAALSRPRRTPRVAQEPAARRSASRTASA